MNALLLALLLAPVPVSADPPLVAASASAQQLLRSSSEERPRALGRRPSDADPRPDTVVLVLALERVARPDERMGEGSGPLSDFPELMRPRARLERLYKTPAHITVTLRRDPARRGAWTARVSAAGREVDAQASWAPGGLRVEWDWRERPDAPRERLSIGARVEVDARGRLTPVEYGPGGTLRQLAAFSVGTPSDAFCRDHCCAGEEDVPLGSARILSFEGRR